MRVSSRGVGDESVSHVTVDGKDLAVFRMRFSGIILSEIATS